MQKLLPRLAAGLLVLGISSVAWANAPAPWWACEGKAPGDTCEQYMAPDGICLEAADCTDDTSTEVNECLQCGADPEGGCSTAAGGSAGLGALLALAALGLRRRRA